MIELRFEGRWEALPADVRRALLDRTQGRDASVMSAASRIVDDVRRRGDVALVEMARRFDGATLDAIEVPRREVDAALDALDPALRRVMERAADNIAAVHAAFRPARVETSPEPGVVVGRRPDPLDRVGVYAPGGRAAYPSSVLMAAVPARVAGVREVLVASPPEASGKPAAVVLAAAAIAEADRVFAIGGAGAIAAFAYGTASVPRVDRIVGPGNAYVAAAKQLVSGAVGIDSPAGPSELLVIADDSADPADIAAELLAQAEHDPNACAVALVTCNDAALRREIERQLEAAPRRDVMLAALRGQGGIICVESVATAVEIAGEYAPEHLLLSVRDPTDALSSVRNAGTVFLGATTSVAFGDYITGANHVLPTAGSARFYSGLSPLDFVRWTTYQRVDLAAAARLAGPVATFADAEGLPAHAAAARRRAARGARREVSVA